MAGKLNVSLALISNLILELDIKTLHYQLNVDDDVNLHNLVSLEDVHYVSYSHGFFENYSDNIMFIISNMTASYIGSMEKILTQYNVWILILGSLTLYEIEKLPLNLESNLLTIESTPKFEETLNVFEWYRVPSGLLRKNQIGTWKENDYTGGKLHMCKASKWERRADLGGIVLKDGMTSDDNFHPDNIILGLHKLPNLDIESRGLMADVIHNLQERLNFTIEIVFGTDDKYGSRNPDDTWNGIIAELQKHNVDISTSGLTITADRSQVTDFTLGIIPDISTLLTRKSSHTMESLNLWAYVTVFPIAVWITTLTAMILSAIFYEIYSRCSIFGQSKPGSGFLTGFALGYLTMLQLGTTSESSSSLTRNFSGRITVLSMSFLAMVLFAHYTGDLTAFMTVGNAKTSLNSFQVRFLQVSHYK